MTNDTETWAAYSIEDLKADPVKQRQVFEEMLVRLEQAGNCRFVFHRLAYAVFGDSFGEPQFYENGENDVR